MERKPFFGRIDNNKIHLSDIGLIASQLWLEIPNHLADIRLDEFIIPECIHAVTPFGFLMKVVLFVIVFTINETFLQIATWVN